MCGTNGGHFKKRDTNWFENCKVGIKVLHMQAATKWLAVNLIKTHVLEENESLWN